VRDRDHHARELRSHRQVWGVGHGEIIAQATAAALNREGSAPDAGVPPIERDASAIELDGEETVSRRATTIQPMSSQERETPASERRDALKEVLAQARGCTRCSELAATRKTVVFGMGNADAELMFVGEAPGASEDEQGLPFVGRAGKLLDQLLEEIGLTRASVFVCNVLKCRPPGNRDPLPIEIGNCQDYLLRQVELIQPAVICTLGNFATKLLRGDPTGITRLHGQPEVLVLGQRAVRLYPIYHPAAALYTPRMLETLREDFARLPELLALGPPEQPAPLEVAAPPEPEGDLAADGTPTPGLEPGRDLAADGTPARSPEPVEDRGEIDQLGLF
jgi:uracil-DNA glycosylase